MVPPLIHYLLADNVICITILLQNGYDGYNGG
jgi:hypothetical protein